MQAAPTSVSAPPPAAQAGPRRGARLIGLGLAAAVAYRGAANLAQILATANPPDVYRKDFIQEYLLGAALRGRVDPYQPVDRLAEMFLGATGWPIMPHATPHPPPVALFAWPFAFLTYPAAAQLWTWLSLACIAASLGLLWAMLGGRSQDRPAGIIGALLAGGLGALLACAWLPVVQTLVLGQLVPPLLLLLVAAWWAARHGRPAQAGLWIGLCLALKLLAWPVVAYLLLRRQWRAAAAAAGTFAAANLLAAILLGPGAIARYYLQVSPQVLNLYQATVDNLSAWGWAWRLFSGMGSPLVERLTAPPLVDAPGLARVAAPLLTLTLAGLGAWLAARCRDDDTAYGLLVVVSILASPIAWSFYLVLALFPALVVAWRLWRAQAAGDATWTAAAWLGILLALPLQFPQSLAPTLARLAGAHAALLAWTAYLALAALPALLAGVRSARGQAQGPGRWPWAAASWVGILLVLPARLPEDLLRAIYRIPDTAAGTVPFAAGLLTLLPAAALLGLGAILWHTQNLAAAEKRYQLPMSKNAASLL